MRRLSLIVLVTTVAAAAVALMMPPAPAAALEGPEWQHALWVAGELRAQPPTEPVAVLLGGSCAREAIVDDASWAADVQRLGGGSVVTYDLGSRRQTFEQDVALVKALPEIPMVVFIGVNLGRFASEFTTTTDTTAPASRPRWVRHHYRLENQWSPERKAERVEFWLDKRLPLFQERYGEHLAQFDLLLKTCVERGYKPVVLALPRDIDAMNHALDAPINRYLQDGRRLAKKHGADFIDFVPDLELSSSDFYDLDHVLESGRRVYERWLAFETARQVATLEPTAAGGTSASPSPSGSPAAGAGSSSAATTGSGAAGEQDERGLAGGTHLLWAAMAGVVLIGVVLAAMRRRAVVRRARSSRGRRSGSRVHGV